MTPPNPGLQRTVLRPAAEHDIVIPTRSRMDEQAKHYQNKLNFEIDSWDLKVALEAGERVIVVDARSPESYARGHIPGAVNIPHRTMSAQTTAHLDKDALVVTYCDGIGCNGSTKGGRQRWAEANEAGFPITCGTNT